jgi:hypothetical protein
VLVEAVVPLQGTSQAAAAAVSQVMSGSLEGLMKAVVPLQYKSQAATAAAMQVVAGSPIASVATVVPLLGQGRHSSTNMASADISCNSKC